MRLPSLESLTERQVSLLVILFGLIVYIPFAASYGLHDPWETHYAEVARQMAVRGDYISLWWPGAPIDPDHFWSKPVLSFWVMSLSLLLFGLGHPASGTLALSTRAEWAVRTPFILFGVLGIYAVYLCVSRFVSRRAGVMAAVVAATSPLYALVSRQAMTDMAFVGPMTMALALGALALFDDEDVLLPRREARIGKRKITWPDHPLFYLATGLFVVVTLPQLVIDSLQLEWTFSLGGSRYTSRRRRDVAVHRRLHRVLRAHRPRPLQGAALPQHRGHAVRPGDAGQGDRRAWACRCWCFSASWRSPGTGNV